MVDSHTGFSKYSFQTKVSQNSWFKKSLIFLVKGLQVLLFVLRLLKTLKREG